MDFSLSSRSTQWGFREEIGPSSLSLYLVSWRRQRLWTEECRTCLTFQSQGREVWQLSFPDWILWKPILSVTMFLRTERLRVNFHLQNSRYCLRGGCESMLYLPKCTYQEGGLLREEVLYAIFWYFRSCTAAALLPRQAEGLFRKMFTKPHLQVAALPSI